ncbi:MAG: hypothetical protein V7693_16160 [Halopseudomonas sabulinigri]
MKVLELKERLIEKLEGFRIDPKTLPQLVYARYANNLPASIVTKSVIYAGARAPKHHKPHMIHTQHRESLIKVLNHLIKRLDIKTLECRFVNPKYNITRPLYNDEIARHTGLNSRTVKRCMGTLVRSGYILRMANTRFIRLTFNLFRDLKLNIALETLRRKALGLEKRNLKTPSSTPSKNRTPDRFSQLPKTGTYNQAHNLWKHEESQTPDPETAKRGIEGLKSILAKRKEDPPPS